MKNKIRMIGMDLDGTLLKTNKELTAYTKDVLKRASEQGIIVMPATGRPFSGIPKELTGLQEIRYAASDVYKRQLYLNVMIRSERFTIMALDMHPKRH